MKKGLHPLSLFLLLMLPPMKLYIPVKGGHPFRFKGGQLGLLFFEGFVPNSIKNRLDGGYSVSNSATNFGVLVPRISVQTVPLLRNS